MKEYEEFKKCMMRQVQERFPDSYRIEIHHVVKNNQLELESLVILCEGVNVSPQFYLQRYYERYRQGESVTLLADEIAEAYRSTLTQCDWKNLDLSLDYCRERIVYRLVSREKNEEQLEGIPYIPFLNLVITFHCLMMQEEDGIGSVRVNNALLEEWGLDHKALFAMAQKNTVRLFPVRICSMEKMLLELLEESENKQYYEEQIKPGECGQESYVLTNEMGVNGAAVILYPDCLSMVGKSIGEDFYLLPSSIHEMLVVPASTHIEREALKNMVREVNRRCVEIDEVLSDDVYFYSRKSGVIEIC